MGVILIDFQKAFDKLDREKLFGMLFNLAKS